MEIDFKSKLITLTPTLDTGAAYTDADQIGVLMTLSDAVNSDGGTATVFSVTGVDAEKKKVPFDIVFYSSAPTVSSSNNAALNISDSEQQAKFLGRVSVGSSDYIDMSANSDFTIKAANCGVGLKAAAASKDVFAILQARSTAGSAFTSASSLTINVFLSQD